MRRHHVGIVPGDEQRHDPGRQGDRLAQEPAHGAHDGRQHDGGDHHIIGYVHGAMLARKPSSDRWRRGSGPRKRGGLYKTVRATARKRVTVREGARRAARAPASGRQGARRPPDCAPDLRVPARGHVSPPAQAIPTCGSPCCRASAPGARHSDGWQNCQAAPSILPESPTSGPLPPLNVRAISCPASRPTPPWCSFARCAQRRSARQPVWEVAAAGRRALLRAHRGWRRRLRRRSRRALHTGLAALRASWYRSEAVAAHAPRCRCQPTRLPQSRPQPARTSAGSVRSGAREPTARSAPRE